MTKRRIALRIVKNVAASNTATIEVPVGPRIHTIELQHGYASGTNTIAAACTNVSLIRVLVNNRMQREVSGTQLRDLNILNGTAYDCTGVPNTAPGVTIPMFFAEPWRKDARDQDALAWQTDGWDTMQVEVTLGAASSPTLVAWAVVDDMKSNVPVDQRAIVKYIRSGIAAAGTSFEEIVPNRKDFLQQITLYPDSGGSNVLTPLTLRARNVVLHELTQSANLALLLHNGMTPAASGRTANLADVVLDHDDLLGSAVSLAGYGVADVTLKIEAGSAMSGTITAIYQRLGGLE